MKLTNDGNIFIPNENGNFVSENQRRVAEVLRDYDSNLELQWIPPHRRGPEDLAFRVVDFRDPHRPYVVTLSNDCDERLLAKVFQADNTKGDVLNYLDAHNAAIEALNLKKQMEEQMEAHELAWSIWRSGKIHYKHNGIDYGKVNNGPNRS